METLPTLIQDLALILLCAGVMSIIFKKLKQPVVLAYIVAGFLAGPYMPYTASIADMESIHTWAEIGVIFLLFGLGLEFSFKKLFNIGTAPVIAVFTSLVCMIAIGFGVSEAFNWGTMDGLYLGGMMAMSSTSIIIKAFDDLGLKQQKFTSIVFSVLILEDIIAIIMMLLFGTLGKGGAIDGGLMFMSILKMVFYLVLWFVAGIYLIPMLLRKIKPFLNQETLLIVSLALCFIMVMFASFAGFSAAFGAFVMGSIMAETTESQRIEHTVAPIKDLFGAIFFVSVGMMIDPSKLVEYWLPILVITLVVLVLRSIVETFAFLLGKVSISTALHCGFSLAQVGEFSFIIATLGISLGAIGEQIYPIIVSVSVITTFTTPFMIKMAEPLAKFIEPKVSPKFRIDRTDTALSDSTRTNSSWRVVLRKSCVIALIYSVLGITVISLCKEFLYPAALKIMPDDWVRFTNLIVMVVTLLVLMVFIRPLLTKNLFDKPFWKLWHDTHFNRIPLIVIVIVRWFIALCLIVLTINIFYQSYYAVIASVALFFVAYFVLRGKLKENQVHMESVFKQNINSKEMESKANMPEFEGELVSKDVHLCEITVPVNSVWCGTSLKDTNWGKNYDINITSILRDNGRINIPSPDTCIFPHDKLQCLGGDESLKRFADELVKNENLVPVAESTSENDMKLMRIAITEGSPLVGKPIFECGIRDNFHCMIAGIDRSKDKLLKPSANLVFYAGDVLWVVGESKEILRLEQYTRE